MPIIIIVLFCIFVYAVNGAVEHSHNLDSLDRSKRFIPFLPGSGTGYIAAVALPISTGPRHVFWAFNFEAHFGLATNNTFSPTELQTLWQGKRSVNDQQKSSTGKKKTHGKASGPMFTRKHVYRVIENNLFRSGFNGTACLLKTICETSHANIYEHNGVFGNLFHIIFTPSSSEDENIPLFFYEAEQIGKNKNCEIYGPQCPKSLLEMTTTTLFARNK